MPERYYVTDNGFIDPGEYVDIDGVIPVPGFNFATFDPRLDGLAGDVGAIARAADCPISFVKVGTDDTAWIVDGRGQRPGLLAVLTAAELNAMCRGFARQPLLDFTPLHIWTPDAANDRFTDSVAGDHLVKVGVGATIDPGPYYDSRSAFGQQAEQTNLQQSYYAAADPAVCDVAEDPYVCMFVAGFAANAGGGLYISKIKYPAPAEDRGWGVSVNLDNGFGFLIRGDITELNYDTATFGANVVDGRTRVFFHGRTIAGALGYTMTPGIPEVAVAGLAGDISNADGTFGLLNDGFALPASALATSRTSKLAWWQGAAADNVTTYRDAIAQGFQDMFGESAHELQTVLQKYDRPVTNAQFAGRTGITCAWYRPDWINAAGNVLSQGSVATLVATGATTQYQKLVSADVGMGFPAVTLDACSANVIPVGLDSMIAGGTFGHVANAGGLNAHGLIGRIVAGAPATGWYVAVEDDGDLKYYVSDGVLSFGAVFAAAALPLNARPIDLLVQIDRTAAPDPLLRLLWARDGVGLGSAEIALPGLGNLTAGGQEFGFGAIPAGAPALNGGGSWHFGFCATGAQAGTSAQFTRVARAVGFLAVEVAAAQAVIG